MSKSPDAFRTISEVADWLGVQAHVLRFWESRFSQVKPVKRAGGRRYYRPNDMRLLGGIKKLLHEDGITIKGVQRILREQGVTHVASLSPSLDENAPEPTADDTVIPFTAPPQEPVNQINMDLGEPAHSRAAETTKPQVPKHSGPQPDEVDAAPLMGGIASLAWNRSEYDDELLHQIAPIAKDLRKWLDRVENHAAG
ncbi:MerR HTH family regulatory protein [Ruegeria halocynthiae]|uniref:MerR HTH family regulatory protein n=1 Tax=Ruegeria halocynthiae TaxID=985054 RepID=A0A1H2SJT0_9RHOB|nr:MerR family transcriptional regulator [Ruegeria halocynthiae]SDW31891.1 MerR HTH family regulatory protein [Ruegeria halocynthiae]